MSLTYFIKLLRSNFLWLLLIPLLFAGSTFYFTRGEKKIFTSETVIYTGIASGSNLSGDNKADYYSNITAFDNLISYINSRQTKQEVLINLLANHLLIDNKNFSHYLMSWNTYDQLSKLVPDSVRVIVVKNTLDATVDALNQYMASSENNLIYTLLNSENPFYSFNALENIKAFRINSSDLIKISYQTQDAVVCRQTLEILEASFMKKYRKLKEGQSESVVEYFEIQTKEAFAKLNAAEQTFMEFNTQNNIINYDEQTKSVVGEKERLYTLNHTIEMDKTANVKSLQKVNESIKGRLYQNEYGTAILKERENLAGVYNQIALNEIVGKTEKGHQQKVDSLKSIAELSEIKLQGSVNSLYAQINTPNGIPTKNVLEQWLKTSLEFEQSKAKLTVMDKQKKDFAMEYSKFAPLGATLKKIEREITVSQQAYLEILHGLNVAKLTQQNTNLNTKMDIIDPPFLPLKANPSKRFLLIIIGFVAGLILALTFIVANALINKTLQRPENAGKILGIPVLGIYPLLNSAPDFIAIANLRLMQQLLSVVDTIYKPVTIGLISIQDKEGKSTIINLWQDELIKLNYSVEIQTWNDKNISSSPYSDIILLEFPALDTMVIKHGMLPKLDYTFLVCRANRVWSKIDKKLLAIFKKITGNHPSLLLNGVKINFAAENIGEVAKQCIFLKSYFKNLVDFKFGNRKSFN